MKTNDILAQLLTAVKQQGETLNQHGEAISKLLNEEKPNIKDVVEPGTLKEVKTETLEPKSTEVKPSVPVLTMEQSMEKLKNDGYIMLGSKGRTDGQFLYKLTGKGVMEVLANVIR